MAQPYQYLYPTQWLNEAQDAQFPPMPLRDDKGAVLPNVATLYLTLYDAGAPWGEVINGLNHTSIKGTARGKLSNGSLLLALTKEDLAVTESPGRTYTPRHALIEYTYGSGGTKTGTLEIHFVVKHVPRFPYVAP